MNTENAPGRNMHSEDEDARRVAASTMGKARTEKKIAASRVNAGRAAEARRGVPVSEEHKAKLREAQTARRERERAERLAAGLVEPPKEKKKPGRPKSPAGQTTAQVSETPQNAPQSQETALQIERETNP